MFEKITLRTLNSSKAELEKTKGKERKQTSSLNLFFLHESKEEISISCNSGYSISSGSSPFCGDFYEYVSKAMKLLSTSPENVKNSI